MTEAGASFFIFSIVGHRVDGSSSPAVYSLAPSAAGLLRIDGGRECNRCGSQCRVFRRGALDTNLSPNAWDDSDRARPTEENEPGRDTGSSRLSSRTDQPHSHRKGSHRNENRAGIKNNVQ